MQCKLAYLIGNTAVDMAGMHLRNLVVSTVSGYFSCTCIIMWYCHRYMAKGSHQLKLDYKASVVGDWIYKYTLMIAIPTEMFRIKIASNEAKRRVYVHVNNFTNLKYRSNST